MADGREGRTEAGASARMRGALSRAADPDGFLPFDRFMEVALYAEEIGYYTRPESPLGPAGDFYTAAHVHPIFGRAITSRLRAIRRALGPERPFTITELGPGDGTLAAAILDALAEHPGETAGLSYHLIDVSPSLLDRALAKAGSAGRAAHVPVRADPGLGADGPTEGVLVANEFLDAQPARRFRWTGEVWRELGFRVTDRGLEPAEAPLARRPPTPEPGTPPEPDTIAEVSPAAEASVRAIADHLARGSVIFLDYGLEESELYAGRPRGTVASVRRHRGVDDYWREPGTSDLSVFVNFSRIRSAARRAGLVELAYGPQTAALEAWGFPRELEELLGRTSSPEETVRLRLAAKNLLFGFERFRVLELSAPESAERLSALRWPGA